MPGIERTIRPKGEVEYLERTIRELEQRQNALWRQLIAKRIVTTEKRYQAYGRFGSQERTLERAKTRYTYQKLVLRRMETADSPSASAAIEDIRPAMATIGKKSAEHVSAIGAQEELERERERERRLWEVPGSIPVVDTNYLRAKERYFAAMKLLHTDTFSDDPRLERAYATDKAFKREVDDLVERAVVAKNHRRVSELEDIVDEAEELRSRVCGGKPERRKEEGEAEEDYRMRLILEKDALLARIERYSRETRALSQDKYFRIDFSNAASIQGLDEAYARSIAAARRYSARLERYATTVHGEAAARSIAFFIDEMMGEMAP